MKLVIQNGCRHSLTRKEIEPMIKLFPSSWGNAVASIDFYGSEGTELRTEYYKKEKTLGLFWPKISHGSQEKVQAIQDLLVSLQCIFETGNLSAMNKSERNYYSDKTKEIREKCLRILNEETHNAALQGIGVKRPTPPHEI